MNNTFKVGDLVRILKSIPNLKIFKGYLGIIFNIELNIVQIAFENSEYDGFDENELKYYKIRYIDHIKSYNYKFDNIMNTIQYINNNHNFYNITGFYNKQKLNSDMKSKYQVTCNKCKTTFMTNSNKDLFCYYCSLPE